ncbi:thiazolylpeptide-type bacteriocin [Idiomarina xiamenensis]|uniref:Thiazolylpeptide-type bacteriocin n=1 Tax=Idiomarina xiamenensis 10-D-4 TaxID=740709 RepID=K2JVW4_9GAMM|nr:thiazolylpeptide-type bacteriocin [Idiomarina xiamenensis]EKE87546.1 hypothetical protein A10D4_00590 [Idiomarina xiamenensis 10-D-4]
MLTENINFDDLNVDDVNLDGLEVANVSNAMALPETGASSGTSSCGSCSTCGSSSCCGSCGGGDVSVQQEIKAN